MSGIMNMFVAAKTTIATAVDAFFNLTTLLLNTSSTNGAQNNTFLDSSTNNFTITRNGNTTQGTFTPFSQTGWSNYFDGSGDYLEVASNAAFNIEGGSYTIEGWVYFNSISTGQRIVVLTGSSSTYALIVGTSSTNNLEVNQFGTGTVITATNALVGVTNSWAHVCVVSNGTNRSIFVNGTRYATSTSAFFQASNNAVGIGGVSGTYSGSNPNAYFSGFRIVKGTAVYDPTLTTLTVPTSPLTAITNTSLLTCQSNRFLDNSTNAFSITVNGNPSVQAFSPFAPTAAYSTSVVGGSGYFDGTGDYLNTSGANLAVGTGDFTYQFWMYASASNPALFDTRTVNNTTTGFTLLLNSSNFLSVYTSSTILTSSTAATLNAWNFVSVVRSSGTLTIYLNGVSVGSTSFTNDLTDSTIVIGRYVVDSGLYLGYMSGFQLLKGTAASGAIPTAPPTNIANTQLLLNYTNSGIFDSTAKNVLETVGDAQVSTTQAKWGTTSMYFDGTGDNLYTINPCLPRSGDFTLEMWIYPTSTSGYQLIYSQFTSGSTDGNFELLWDEFNEKFNVNFRGATLLTSSSTYSLNAWHHLAIVRSGSTFTMYVDGASAATATNSDTILQTASYVGTRSLGDGYFAGYIDDLRITRGYARYSGSTYTVPTAAFPVQ